MPTVDMFGPFHKAIRHALGSVVTLMGQTDFGDAQAATRILEDLEGALWFCDQHLDHEERYLRPAIEARRNGPIHTFEVGHEIHHRLSAEVRGLAKNGFTRALYLHTTKLAAEMFSHMAEEEEVLQPLLEKLFTESELRELSMRARAAMSQEEILASARFILPAITPSEQTALLAAG